MADVKMNPKAQTITISPIHLLNLSLSLPILNTFAKHECVQCNVTNIPCMTTFPTTPRYCHIPYPTILACIKTNQTQPLN